jgi:acetyl coenzyme A synthetase (ADP forming)-like protein
MLSVPSGRTLGGVSALRAAVTQSVDVALRDGSSVHVRPVTEADGDGIRRFFEGISPESMNLRFFGQPSLDWAVRWAVDVDEADRHGIVAESGSERTIVAHAAYIRTSETRAEVAFLVADSIQGHGIGTLMLAHLAAVARSHGIEVFTAEVLGANHRMIDVFRDSGFPVTLTDSGFVVGLEFPTALTEETIAAFDRRGQLAAINALRVFLAPRSVAVIGASERAGTIGAELIGNIVDGGYTGVVFPVNRRGGMIRGLSAHSSVRELPMAPELAVVAVPSSDVLTVAAECAAVGVRALLIVSAGFGELGADGLDRQRELLALCRRSGLRVIGPNCLGVINTDPAISLNASFATHDPPAGRIGFLSQSGGLGIALIEAADRLGLGLSSFVSVGNKADISGNDLLEYWENDAATDVILLYLESFGNPRRFARIARRVSRRKPILAVKSGRSPAGARATSSHTGALLSASDVTVDALFRQAGVIRADTMGALLGTASLLSTQPVPRGRRVAIVTNGGGPGVLAADACQAVGLDVVDLSEASQTELRSFLPRGASVGNPIDMIATARAEDYCRTIEVLVASDTCDAIISLFVPPLVTAAADVARELERAATTAPEVTCAAVFMERGQAVKGTDANRRVPHFAFPEDAVRAIADAVLYGEWRARPSGARVVYEDARPRDAAAIIQRQLAEGEGWLAPEDVTALLGCYGLPLVGTHVARTTRAALDAAADAGYPVAVKAIATGLVHKSDAGAVEIGIEDPDALRGAVRRIRRRVKQAGYPVEGFIVQPMITGAVELLVGVVHDESFGPVIACGAGGTAAELIGDVAVRITPLSDLDAAEMLTSLRTYPLLTGYRGAPPCDIDSIKDALLRLSALVEAHPEIAELDANPLLARPDGAVIIDARVRLAPAPQTAPIGSLRGAS